MTASQDPGHEIATANDSGLRATAFDKRLAGHRSVWDVISFVAAALDAEAHTESGRTFELSWEDSQLTHRFPMLRRLTDAAEDVGQFADLIELFGHADGFLTGDGSTRSPQDVCHILALGRDSMATLDKDLLIAEAYYARPAAQTALPPADVMAAIVAVREILQTDRIRFAQLPSFFPDAEPPIALAALGARASRVREDVMTMDPGPSVGAYDNANGRIVFFENGAVTVTIDSQAPDANGPGGRNELLWGTYSRAMDAAGIETNAESHSSGPQTYTIPPGAGTGDVLSALVQASFITGAERDLLARQYRLRGVSPAAGARLAASPAAQALEGGAGL